MTATRVRVVTGCDAVREALATLPAAMRPTAFQHPAWTGCWLGGAEKSEHQTVLALVECAETARPLFALPLTLDTFGAAAYWAPLDHGACDYNASFTAPDFRPSPVEMQTIWTRIVAALPDDAAFLMIDKLPAVIGERAEPLMELPGLRRSHVVRHPLHLDADYATLRDTRFSQTSVRSLARKRRKLSRKGDLVFSVATGEAAAAPLERLLVWRGERYGVRPDIDDFYRRLVRSGDPARVMWLALDGEPVSAGFGLVEPTAFRLLAIGHEERFKNWSPGLLVIEDAIAWAIDLGLAEFDFTIGSEAYKFDFGVTPEPLWLVAEEFGPHGSAMLRLMLARNMIAKKLKRWIDPNAPRRRDAKASAA
jgi:CelD/BcsL family acetyltransferase involved in cellulose biosynthesis